MEPLVMIKKGADKYIYKIPGTPSLYETKKKSDYTELPISLGEYCQFDWKNNNQKMQ